ncbi:MAG TPA: TIGR01777 family oxidoreductase [Chitinophagaceae bacterium]|nr:TIGR01777 family oxidoreductase [Chitinophagaceae bacterium]
MPVVLIAGGTGFIGTALTDYLLKRNYTVIVMSRSVKGQPFVLKPNTINFASWNTDTQTMDIAALTTADYIINLAGAGIAEKRWTPKRKMEIQQSRIKSGNTIAKCLKESNHRVKGIISASAIGWYGSDPKIPNDHPFTEDAKADNDFLGKTCQLWEESVEEISTLNIPLIKLRIGIVLSNKGGALKEFIKPLQFGIAAILGNGKQMISWIHIIDLCRIIEYAIQHEKMEGVYNAVAPKPVNNKTLTMELGRKLKGKFFIPLYVPAFVLKLALGEMSIEILKSTTVSCKKIQDAGFTFLYPSIDAALADLHKQ